jgi:glutamate 5-kinase
LYIDNGAHRALVGKAGLLPAGVVDVEGSFAQQEAVRICVVDKRIHPGSDGKLWDGPAIEVGRALVNYSSNEVSRIKGHQSTEILGLLGYADSEYVAHREHICFFRRESRPVSPIRDLIDSMGIGGYESGASSGL